MTKWNRWCRNAVLGLALFVAGAALAQPAEKPASGLTGAENLALLKATVGEVEFEDGNLLVFVKRDKERKRKFATVFWGERFNLSVEFETEGLAGTQSLLVRNVTSRSGVHSQTDLNCDGTFDLRMFSDADDEKSMRLQIPSGGVWVDAKRVPGKPLRMTAAGTVFRFDAGEWVPEQADQKDAK